MRVLVVARWYPAFDDTSRGRFVADHVAALAGAGVEVTVASFEPVFVRGDQGTRAVRAAAARALWARPLATATALHLPAAPDEATSTRSSIAGSSSPSPVARLPVVLDAGTRSDLEEVDAYVAALEPFVGGLARRWPFDLVHAHTGIPDGLAAARVGASRRLPLVVTEHDSTLQRRLAVPAVRNAYRSLATEGTLLAVSDGLARVISEALDLPAGAITVVPNPVAVDSFVPSPFDARDADELLYVGNRKASKGIDDLLRAFARLRKQKPDRPGLHLRLIGRSPDGEEERRWIALARDLGIDRAISFEPPSDRPGVAAAMARASIFVHPSPRETFGVVAAEALAAGLPVAAAPSEGVSEILGTSGAYGEVASGPDDASLAIAIGRLLDRRAQIDSAGLRQRALAYSPAAVAGRTLEIYESLVEPGGGDAAPVAGGEEPAALVSPPEEPCLVIGLSRPDAARRVAPLSHGLAARLTVVTTRPGAGGPAALPAILPRGPRWLEIDPDAPYLEGLASLGRPLPRGAGLARRLGVLVRHPIAAARRQLLYQRREALRERAIEAGLRSAWEQVTEAGCDGDGPAGLVLALDADDALAARGLIETGAARLAPGSLRWVADGWAVGAGESGTRSR